MPFLKKLSSLFKGLNACPKKFLMLSFALDIFNIFFDQPRLKMFWIQWCKVDHITRF